MTAPSPTTSCVRCSPMRSRSSNPKAAQSQALACGTSSYASTGITVAVGIERFSGVIFAGTVTYLSYIEAAHAAHETRVVETKFQHRRHYGERDASMPAR